MVRLGFIHNAADDIYNGQGINLINKWSNLDDDDVKTLLWNVQKLGSGRPCEMIRFKSKMNLHLTVLFIHHKNRTIRLVNYGDITVPRIHALKKQQEMESTKGSKLEDITINMKDVSKTYKLMIQYLCGIHGCDECLLATL